MVAAREGRWDDAERSFRRAIELDPNSSTNHSDYAYWLLTVLGRQEDALAQMRLAARADPLSKDVRLTTALILVSAGR